MKSVISRLHIFLGSVALCLGFANASAQAVQLDPKLPAYKVAQGVSGNLKSVGSDTMNELMATWTEGFKKLYPSVTTEMEGKGSATAPPALVAGSTTFGAMSRLMKSEEIDQFEKAFGYKPTEIPTSIDALAVFVHKDNPLKGLTFQQIDALFSKTRKGGATQEIHTWGELGLTGDWANKPISLYGRDSSSGTYLYFKEHALFKGDFRDDVKEQKGSSGVVGAVATDKYAIGYSGIGYRTSDVRAVPLASAEGKPFVEATSANAYSGEYPLSRFLYVYVNQKPGTELDPLRREFIRYMLSKEGQSNVVEKGFYPLTADLTAKALGKVGIKNVMEASNPK